MVKLAYNSNKQPKKQKPRKARPLTAPRPPPRQKLMRDKDLRQFAAASAHPFNESAEGARIPDMWSYPTATYHTKGTLTLSSDANGVASAVCLPCPYLTIIEMTASNAQSGMYKFNASAATQGAYAAVQKTVLSGVLGSYRVVGFGIRVRNMLPPTTCTGRVLMASVPVIGDYPPYATLDSALNRINFDSLCEEMVGIQPSGPTVGLPSDILRLPEAHEVPMTRLIAAEVEWASRPVTPEYFNFKDSHDDAINIGYIISNGHGLSIVGDTTVDSSSGTTSVNNSRPAANRAQGMDALLFRAEGLPASTVAAIELEYVLHLEGSPMVSIVSGGGGLAPSSEPRAVVNPSAVDVILGGLAQVPRFLEGVGNVAGQVAEAVPVIGGILAKIGMTLF